METIKYFYFLFLVIMCKGLHPCINPKDIRVITNGDDNKTWLDIHWSKVENFDNADPILGYKVKMWVIEPKTKYTFENTPDGHMGTTPTGVELPKLDVNKEPSDKLTEIIVPANETKATIEGLEKGKTYEIGVHSYTATCQGTLTTKMRIKLEPNDNV